LLAVEATPVSPIRTVSVLLIGIFDVTVLPYDADDAFCDPVEEFTELYEPC